MRARVLAFVILLILLGVPSFLYWYFFSKQTSNLHIETNLSSAFHVELRGTISSSALPLADKFLVYKKECLEICDFSSIPPVEYEILLKSPGMIPVSDVQMIAPGETKNIVYTLNPELITHESTGGILVDDNLAISLVDNANITLSGTFFLVGAASPTQIYALRKIGDSYQLGLIFPEKFISIRDIPNNIERVGIDITRQYFLLTFLDGRTLAISTKMDAEVELPVLPNSLVQFDTMIWKIQTASGAYLYDGDSIIQNPRFTDFLDISSTIRIGYIDQTDKKRLELSNFPLNESVLVFLNRGTGENYVLKKGISIKTLYFDLDGSPVYMDGAGKTWEITLPTK